MVADAPWLRRALRGTLSCSAFCSIAPLSGALLLLLLMIISIDRFDRSIRHGIRGRPSVGLDHVADIFGGVADENDTSTLSERPSSQQQRDLGLLLLASPLAASWAASFNAAESRPFPVRHFPPVRPRASGSVWGGMMIGQAGARATVSSAAAGWPAAESRCSAVEAIPLSGAFGSSSGIIGPLTSNRHLTPVLPTLSPFNSMPPPTTGTNHGTCDCCCVVYMGGLLFV